MKIYIGTFELAGTGQLAPDSLRINSKRIAQIATYLRAESAKPFNRQNTLTTVSFSVTREHDSMREAHIYMLDHEVKIPQSGNVKFVAYNQGGAESNYWFDVGILETTDASHMGLTTFHSYRLIGGRFTQTEPGTST